ncbi:hypothetical protein T11_6905 [Trichinella zimbabwensis]|uniref:Uncharacterized protein n=1 Tax=Trichinella zimbabwensis TaxID=268475 RepID=A0A0V1HTF2_9BILA|nr:hypothetical protein T11_6905 [Trichinella zimbabwensis]
MNLILKNCILIQKRQFQLKPLLQSWSLADSLSTLSAARCCDSSAYRASSSFTPYTLTQLANSGNVEKFSDEDNS